MADDDGWGSEQVDTHKSAFDDGGWGDSSAPNESAEPGGDAGGWGDSNGGSGGGGGNQDRPPFAERPRRPRIQLDGDSNHHQQQHNNHFGAENGEEADKPPPFRPEEIDLDAEEQNKISQGINFDRFDRIQVSIQGAQIEPVDQFCDLITSDLLLNNIKRAGYTKMTPIQRYTIPALAKGLDLVGCAQTGSGKTAAFLLPVLQYILNIPDLESQFGADTQRPYCLVIAPTRELVKQTYVEALKLSRDSMVKCQYIYGQVQTGFLRAQLCKGTHILVATPGRLKDFIEKGWVGLDNLKYVILDEGDRLIDDGFLPDMANLFSNPSMPSSNERQTMFFSATFKDTAKSAASQFMKPNYAFITVGMVGAANEDVKQEFIKIERANKKRELKRILQSLDPEDKVIVFTQTKATADILSGFLHTSGISSTSIHGDRHQSQREQALAEFKRGSKKCLVASPVGERGLDLPKVSLVINYDLPNELDEYIHRIGRTGRIGNTGRAISFFDPDRDNMLMGALERALKQAQQAVPDFFNQGYTETTTSTDGLAEEKFWD